MRFMLEKSANFMDRSKLVHQDHADLELMEGSHDIASMMHTQENVGAATLQVGCCHKTFEGVERAVDDKARETAPH